MKNDCAAVTRKISIKAERLVSGNELLRVISFLPNAKLTSTGSCYSFDINLGSDSTKLLMGCCRDCISLEFKSKSAEDLSLCDISILTLSMLAYLKDLYSAKLESLYPILINSLRDAKKGNSKGPESKLEVELYEEIRRSNVVLSETAIKMVHENAMKSADLSKFSSLFGSVAKTYWNDTDAIRKFCISSGAETETVKWALEYKKAFIDESI
jgi:hypothetical protein